MSLYNEQNRCFYTSAEQNDILCTTKALRGDKNARLILHKTIYDVFTTTTHQKVLISFLALAPMRQFLHCE